MSDIFLSYKSEDRARAQTIAEVFEKNGYSVWWDRIIPIGKQFDEYIQERLDDAKCVVVLWSNESIKSKWVKDEAREKEILFSVLIEDVKPPLGFKGMQAANLVNWNGKSEDPDFSLLLKSIGDTIGKSPVKISEPEIAKKKQTVQEEQIITEMISKKKKIDLPEATLPLVDITFYMNPIRDQGPKASVVGFATAAALEYQIYKKLKKKVIISPQYIYYLSQIEGKLDPLSDSGAFIKDAVKILETRGAVLEDVWPFNSNDDKTIPIDQIDKAEKYKITNKYQLKTVEEIKSAIQNYGPVVAGFTMFASYTKAAKKGIIPDPVPNEQLIGGIATCIVGYNDEKRLFKFRNSWGIGWGEKGYGYISYDYIKKYSSDNWIFWI